jgi:hypothetical protein
MESLEIEKNTLILPVRIANKLRGKRIVISEIKEGILLKTAGSPITEARGFLKGKRFTSSRFMQTKKKEKGLE